MDVFTIARACVRRWYVFIPLVALAALLTVYRGAHSTATYSQSAQFLLTSPAQNSTEQASSNPLANSSTALTALTTRLNAYEFASTVSSESAGFGASAGAKGPILVLTAEGTSASGVTATLRAAAQGAPTQFSALQSEVGAPAAAQLRLIKLQEDTFPLGAYPHRTRSVVLTALASLAVIVFLVEILDFLLVRRRGDGGRRERLPAVGRDDAVANAESNFLGASEPGPLVTRNR